MTKDLLKGNGGSASPRGVDGKDSKVTYSILLGIYHTENLRQIRKPPTQGEQSLVICRCCWGPMTTSCCEQQVRSNDIKDNGARQSSNIMMNRWAAASMREQPYNTIKVVPNATHKSAEPARTTKTSDNWSNCYQRPSSKK